MKCCQSGFPSFKGISHQQRQRLFCVAVGEWLWLLPHRQGTPELLFTPASHCTIWMSQGFFCMFSPRVQTKYDCTQCNGLQGDVILHD